MKTFYFALGTIAVVGAVIVLTSAAKKSPAVKMEPAVMIPSPASTALAVHQDIVKHNDDGSIKAGYWTAEPPKVNPIDGKKTIFITNDRNYVELILCYQNGKPCEVGVYVDAPKNCYVESNLDDSVIRRRVRVRFDDNPARTEIWGIVDSHEAIYPPSQSALRKELQKHKTMYIEFGCASYDNEVSSFDTWGLKPLLDDLKIDPRYQ